MGVTPLSVSVRHRLGRLTRLACRLRIEIVEACGGISCGARRNRSNLRKLFHQNESCSKQ